MSGNSLFPNSRHMRIGDSATFQVAGRDQILNIYNETGRESQWVTLSGNTYRRIPMGDIIVRKDVSSEVLDATLAPRSRTSISGTGELSQSKAMKIKKTVQHVEVLGLPGGFTSVTLEPVEEGRAEDFKAMVDRVCREISSRRSPIFTQLAGLGWSERPTFIIHEELANGYEFTHQLAVWESYILHYYLWYTTIHRSSHWALRADATLTIPVSSEWRLWTFNPRTHAWQYDIASVSISPPNKDISLDPIHYSPIPLRQDTHPQLDTDEIIACFEEQFGDFLHLVASSGDIRHVEDPSGFARHGYLTFGTVVDCNKPGILAHFPSTPSLKWSCYSVSGDVGASYSTTVPSRIDLSFKNTDSNRALLHFSLHTISHQYRTAYLSQSVPFLRDHDNIHNDLMFIHDVRFSLVGTFHHWQVLAKSTTPAYLFVPPILAGAVNDVCCIRYPLPNPFFYWCSDPNGHNIIREEDWEAYGIPRLETFTWFGSAWYLLEYKLVQDHLQKNNYPLDGRQYAQNHGYPKLVYGDPHDPLRVVVEELDQLGSLDGPSKSSEHSDSSDQETKNSDKGDTPRVAADPNPTSNKARKSRTFITRNASSRTRAFSRSLVNHRRRVTGRR
ncbi:hypothetical protein PM082_023020 [Marasmius tenuissimus]|nr:hypothetical protein PM082_023020 [Marasmius tenuissimus]